MEEAPPRDGTFQLVPSATPGVSDFKVARNYGTPKPDFPVAAGTTYANATNMTSRPELGGLWDSYVAAQSEPAGNRLVWQYFVASLPTTPTVASRIDPLWGPVFDHAFLDLITNTRQDRGELFELAQVALSYSTDGTTAAGAMSYSDDGTTEAGPLMLNVSRMIEDVKEQDLGQGLCRVVLTTVENGVVTAAEQVLDAVSGKLVPLKTENILSPDAPAAHDLDAVREYAETAKVRHNHWLRTTRRGSGLPASRAEAVPFFTTGTILWPAVLDKYEVLRFSNDHADEGYDRDWLGAGNPEEQLYGHVPVISFTMRKPYSTPVKMEMRRWFQVEPPEVTVDPEMLESEVKVAGRSMNFTIPECLHGSLLFEEYSYSLVRQTSPDTGTTYSYSWRFHNDVSWRFTATNVTDWPATVRRFQAREVNGGYECEERIYHKPTNYNTSTMLVTSAAASEFFWRVSQ